MSARTTSVLSPRRRSRSVRSRRGARRRREGDAVELAPKACIHGPSSGACRSSGRRAGPRAVRDRRDHGVARRSCSSDQLFAAIHTEPILLSSPLCMFLFTTPLDCDLCIHYLPARRAEAHGSIRTPMVHVGAGDSCLSQLFRRNSGSAQGAGRPLRVTVKSVGSLPCLGSLYSSPPVSESRRRRREPRPSGIPLRARPARPPLWIGTLPRRIRAARRSCRKSSPDRRRTLPRLGLAGGEAEPAQIKACRVLADLHARSLGAASLRTRGSARATLSSPSAEQQPDA